MGSVGAALPVGVLLASVAATVPVAAVAETGPSSAAPRIDVGSGEADALLGAERPPGWLEDRTADATGGPTIEISWPEVLPSMSIPYAIGRGFVPGSTVEISIDNAVTGPGIDWSSSRVVSTSGTVERDLWEGLPYQLAAGDVVRFDGAPVAKSVVVDLLRPTTVDVGADTLGGTATPGTTLLVSVGVPVTGSVPGSPLVTADGEGLWVADFSVAGPGPGEEETFDLMPDTALVELTTSDDDGDTNTFQWRPEVPSGPYYLVATPGDHEVVITWGNPGEGNVLPVLEYEVVVQGPGTELGLSVPGSQRTVTVGGLLNGTGYVVRVRAVNALGPGEATGSHTVTPRGCGDPPLLSDVVEGHPFCDDIEWMVLDDVAEGYPDGTFRPAVEVSRQAMAVYLYRVAGSPDGEDPSCEVAPFVDVPVEHPFCGEISWAVEAEAVEGYGDGTFRPAAPTTRQALAVFLHRLAGEPAFTPPSPPSFSDVPVDHPFRVPVEWMAAEGLASGYEDGTFRPTSPVTRQAVAAFLHRFAAMAES